MQNPDLVSRHSRRHRSRRSVKHRWQRWWRHHRTEALATLAVLCLMLIAGVVAAGFVRTSRPAPQPRRGEIVPHTVFASYQLPLLVDVGGLHATPGALALPAAVG